MIHPWLYMLSRPIDLTVGYPVGRENPKRAWLKFSEAAPGTRFRDLVWVDPRAPVPTSRPRAEGTKAGY